MSRNFEVCSFNINDIVKVASLKPARIEFCQNKSAGGLTPNLNDLDYAISTRTENYQKQNLGEKN